MNGKKLWLFAILFGLVSAIILYFIIQPSATRDSVKSGAKPLPSDEQLEETVVQQPGSQLLSIAEGKRAISISVNELQGVSGFIVPGSYVDIIATYPDKNSQLLVENSKVLAVGRSTTIVEDASANTYQTLTLEIKPEDGILITNATSKGVLNLMLKGIDQ
ncbi:Flp pilus assembly protein CpaB [Fredinandcohnia humi]